MVPRDQIRLPEQAQAEKAIGGKRVARRIPSHPPWNAVLLYVRQSPEAEVGPQRLRPRTAARLGPRPLGWSPWTRRGRAPSSVPSDSAAASVPRPPALLRQKFRTLRAGLPHARAGPRHTRANDTPRASPAEEKDGASHSCARPALKSSTHRTCGIDLRVEDLHGGEGAGVGDLGGHW
jgi:hypothetical protein